MCGCKHTVWKTQCLTSVEAVVAACAEVDVLAGMLAQASLSLLSSLAAQLRVVLTSKASKTATLCAPASTKPSLQA